ncbi:TonB-dependent siderophore receptor [Neogemmobacter tilapiae]|uniref:TonB-dependent receptor n=1 Tax=Neogemmobacter tilapiae TaxID=875041 RepID=A0A918TWI7_9RHOB|nr:TonB-dependent siderophore receptor [Gemmobacter tilapiae]GHC65428.1 TonB-dependent receptor [Gemmobacter tilapiae]
MTPFQPARLPHLLLCHTALISLSTLPLYAQDAETTDLAPIIVQEKLAYSGAIEGYLAPATETGVKSGVPLAEVPQSISVVTTTELEFRKPRQIEDAIKFVPGINASTWGTDNRYDQFSLRGFDMGTGALYRDGLPQKALNFTAFSTDPYMIERVDVLRGPAGVLYGSNDAGGMVNLVTKRPVFDRVAEGRLGFASHGTAEAAFDWGNVLNAEGTLAGRLTGLVRDGGTAVDGAEDDRYFIAGGLTWAPTDQTSLTILAHVQKDGKQPLIMTPVNGEDIDPAWGTLPTDFPFRQSDYNHFDTEQESFGWELTHKFDNGLTLNHRLRYAHQTTDYAQLDYSYADAAGMYYYAFRNDEDAKTLGLDTNLEWNASFGAIENTLIAGFDYQRSQNKVTQYYDGTLYTVPFANPALDFAVTDPALGSTTRSTYVEKGLYIQDHMKFDGGTTLTAGLRQSWFENRSEDLIGGTSDSQDDKALTGMIGLTHEFANGLTPYVSYTEGFIQNVGKTITGETLDPSKSKQVELGLRYQPGDELLLSASLFDLRKTNVKDYDLSDPTFSSFVTVGEIRSRGLELEARGRLTDRLQGMLSYAYLDTKITKSADASKLGNHNAMAPQHQLSLWVDYDASALLDGLTIGTGLRYQSDSFSTQDNGRKTQGGAVADLSIRYEADSYTVDLGVSNLFDRDYYGVCYDSYGCAKGEGRVATLSVSTKF